MVKRFCDRGEGESRRDCQDAKSAKEEKKRKHPQISQIAQVKKKAGERCACSPPSPFFFSLFNLSNL
jgi:hypothetical protein